MLLTLEVVAPSEAHLGENSHAFAGDGGTVGRSNDCDWVLPDTRVSSRHARISSRRGVFYIEDTSSNGVYLNSPANRLPRGQPCELQQGDCLFIVPYEIRVSMSDDRMSTPVPGEIGSGRSGPAGPLGILPGAEADPFAPKPPVLEPVAEEELDPLKLIGAGPRPARRPSGLDALAGASPLDLHFEPPAVAPPPVPPQEPVAIPADYDPLGPDSSPGPLSWMPPRQPQTPPPVPDRVTAYPVPPWRNPRALTSRTPAPRARVTHRTLRLRPLLNCSRWPPARISRPCSRVRGWGTSRSRPTSRGTSARFSAWSSPGSWTSCERVSTSRTSSGWR